MNSNSVRILIKEKDNKDKEYVVSKKDAELSELLTGTINDYPDDPVVPLQDVDQKTIERISFVFPPLLVCMNDPKQNSERTTNQYIKYR